MGHCQAHHVSLPDGDTILTPLTWLKFNAVGIAGAGVQLAALWLFARLLHIQYIGATVLAVEVAVLHNFAWHEAWTWRGLPAEDRWRRLARFHVANGFVSIVSNALLTWLFRQGVGLPLLVSNLGAIGLTAILNYVLAAAWVFYSLPSQRMRKPTA